VSTHSRPERVAQMVQQLLGEIFARGMRDPRIGLVTITGVKMSPDLREARVYWAVHGDAEQRQHTAKGLDNARGFLRREVGRELKLRVVPDLHFTYDEAIDRGERIELLIRQVHAEADGRNTDDDKGRGE
jgi:ribosome-binding factor A